MSSGPHHGGGRRACQRRRRRGRRHERTGNDDLEKAPEFETVVRLREHQMRVETPLLDSSGPAIAYGPSGTQCPIPNCSSDGSKRHAFECHLPAICREELHGQEITIRRIGALSMIASWLPGDRATLRSYPRIRVLRWELNPHRHLCCPKLGMKNGSWFIGRWCCGY